MTELPRKERERLRHRREMLEAAETVFSRKGFYGTTVQEIAEEAEFSVGAIYNVFESKEDLYFQLVEMRADEYIDTVYKQIGAAAEPIEKIRVVITTKLDFFKQHKQFFRIFSHVVGEGRPGSPPPMSERCLREYAQYQERLKGIFQEGIRQGAFAEWDPLLMVLCLEGTTNAVLARWVYAGGDELENPRPEEIERMFLRGVLAEGNQR